LGVVIKLDIKNEKFMKKIILLSAIVFLSAFGLIGTVNAAGASLYVLPASLTKTVGNIFSVSVGFNASGSKICAIEGTLVFNNLTCQNITVTGDVMTQSSPTCLNHYFLIGIPNCTTLDKKLLTLSVKAGSAGNASVSVTGVDIIGEGSSVGSASTSGNYTIINKAVSAPTPVPTPTPIPTPTPETASPTPLFDITAKPVLPARQNVVLPVVFSVIAGILLILFVIFIVRWIWIFMIAKKKKKKEENIKK